MAIKYKHSYQGIFIFSIILFFSCEPKVNHSEISQALFSSNEIQRKAHLENNADLLVSEIADSMISMQNGDIQISSNEEIKNRFQAYFSNVRYTSWDDTQAPIIEISQDGSMASVFVKKLIQAQMKDQSGDYSPHGYTLFAWNALYRKEESSWKIYANTSTRKELSAEEAARIPIHFSEEYALIPERDLIPEGVAYDNTTGITYLSSTFKQKIVAIKPDGSYTDFKTEQEDGLWSTVGMEVDEVRKKLWVISSNAHEVLPMKHPDSITEWSSKVYEYQLPSGQLLNIYQAEIEGQYSFNDICISKSGDAYISESVQNKVYRLKPPKQTFEALSIPDSLFIFPNGVTTSDDDRYLYITNVSGIVQYDLQEDKYKFLEKHSGIINNGLDGLAYYKGTLIGNQAYRRRILQFELDEENGKILSQRILEANHPDFDQPSTGEIAGDSFIYLANAQMRSGFENGQIKPLDSLKDVKLLKVFLDL